MFFGIAGVNVGQDASLAQLFTTKLANQVCDYHLMLIVCASHTGGTYSSLEKNAEPQTER